MRRLSKFKFKDTRHVYPYQFSPRILSFNRPKWRVIQRKILFLQKGLKFLKEQTCSVLKNRNFKNFILVNSIIQRKEMVPKIFSLFFNRFKQIFSIKKYRVRKKSLKHRNKKKSKKSKLLNNFYFNFTHVKSKLYSWSNQRWFFKEDLLMKSSIIKYFDNGFSIDFFKKQFIKNTKRAYAISSIFARPEFRADVLLWRLKYFNSIYLAQRGIKTGQILLNNKRIDSKFFLKQGDVLKIRFNKSYSFKKTLAKRFKVLFIPSFVEVDYYTNTVIILKNYFNFIGMDLNTVIKEPLCFYKFKNYILN
jgi:ribosomal 50S subunit-recycling heat shock protein